MDNITDEELARLKACTSEQEWNDTCSVIKKARNGNFPDDWWPKVMQSGLAESVAKTWGGTAELKLHRL